jgi:stage V sporulation protein B
MLLGVYMTGKKLAGGIFVLAASGFLVKLLGFFYRVHLSNLIGAEGMGLFQLIAPVYSLVIVTLASGISTAVSKMNAAETAYKNTGNIRRILACSVILVVGAGTVISIFMMLNINFICNVILKDNRTYYAFMVLIPCIPVIAIAAVLRGYFYGISQVMPTALSQVVEQIIRISLVLGMAEFMIKAGMEYACMLAAIGMAAGEVSNLIVLYLFYVKKNKNLSINRTIKDNIHIKRKSIILKEIFSISIPVSTNKLITSAMSALEYLMIPRMLVLGSLSYNEGIKIFGVLTGMAIPVLYFPSPVTSSLATTMVPVISEGIALRNYSMINRRISVSIQMTFILGFISTMIFSIHSNEIAEMIFREQGVGRILYMISFTSVTIYLNQIMRGIMNGLGKQGTALLYSIIGHIIRIGTLLLLVPSKGIAGYIWGIGVSLGIINILNIYTVTKTTGLSINLGKWIIRPGFVCVIMYFINKYVEKYIYLVIRNDNFGLIINIIGDLVIMLLLMYSTGVFNREEINLFFKLKKLRNYE